MFGSWQPTGGLKGQVCSLACELAATWRWPTLAQMNRSELSRMAGAIDDSTINIVVVIIIFYYYYCLVTDWLLTDLLCSAQEMFQCLRHSKIVYNLDRNLAKELVFTFWPSCSVECECAYRRCSWMRCVQNTLRSWRMCTTVTGWKQKSRRTRSLFFVNTCGCQ